MMYRPPPSEDRTRPASLKIALTAGSWSDFTSKSPCRIPTSFMNETSLLDVNDLALFAGTTVASSSWYSVAWPPSP